MNVPPDLLAAPPAGVEWHGEPGAPRLHGDIVHVWRVPLRLPCTLVPWAEALLDPAELERASRFRFAEHRGAFVAGRAIQREVLSRYLRIAPREVRYRVNAYGKPEIEGQPARSGIQFNFSNAAELGLLAVAVGRATGVDVEAIRPMADGMDVARRFFSIRENDVLRTVPPALRDQAFFRCWTRKEAYIKAVGRGLSIPLDGFDVAFAPGEEARLLRCRDDPREAERWTMHSLEPGQGYVGALAVEGDGWALQMVDWRPLQNEPGIVRQVPDL